MRVAARQEGRNPQPESLSGRESLSERASDYRQGYEVRKILIEGEVFRWV